MDISFLLKAERFQCFVRDSTLRWEDRGFCLKHAEKMQAVQSCNMMNLVCPLKNIIALSIKRILSRIKIFKDRCTTFILLCVEIVT